MTCDHKWTVDAELGDHKSSIIRCVICQETYIGELKDSVQQERRKDPILTGDVGYIHRRKDDPQGAKRIHQRKAPIPIDDAMKKRFHAEMARRGWLNEWANKESLEAALEAALNPKPPEPEIPVTDEMIEAGQSEWAHSLRVKTPGHAFANVFRAMAKVAPK